MKLEEKLIIAENCGFNPADAEEWYYKYLNQKGNTTYRGLQSELTFGDYLSMAQASGITQPDQIGRKTDNISLVESVIQETTPALAVDLSQPSL